MLQIYWAPEKQLLRLLNLPSDKAVLSHPTRNEASLTKVCGR